MTQINLDDALDRFEKWHKGLSEDAQEKLLKFCFVNRPRPHINISELLGFQNTGKSFDLNLAQGQIAENELAQILAGQIEVKTDSMVSRTGNVAIEHFCWNKPSGISTSESEWWAIVLSGEKYKGEVIVLIKRGRLLKLVKGTRSVKGGDFGIAQMYLLPVERLVE